MMALNYWHFISFGVIFIIFGLGIFASIKQKDFTIAVQMIISVSIVSIFLVIISIFMVDKYTKKAKVYKLTSKRILVQEKVEYSGRVKNVGDFPIGKVTLTIKLINQGHVIGRINGGNIFKTSNFFDLFSSGENILYNNKPQTIEREFVIARNLQPKVSTSFHVRFDFPPYFSNVSVITKVTAH